jgi:hypothetical protein
MDNGRLIVSCIAAAALSLVACGNEDPASDTAASRAASATSTVIAFPAPLPDDGYAVGRRGQDGVEFFDLNGKRVASIPTARLEDHNSNGPPDGTVRLVIRGRAFVARAGASALASAPRKPVERPAWNGSGCVVTDEADGVQYAVCDPENGTDSSTIVAIRGAQRTTLLGFPRALYPDQEVPSIAGGHWRWALVSPDGQWVLAQYSSDCETTFAFLVPARGGPAVLPQGGAPKDVPQSVGYGWASTGEALVRLAYESPCGSGVEVPGIYAIADPGNKRFLVADEPSDPGKAGTKQVALWFSG